MEKMIERTNAPYTLSYKGPRDRLSSDRKDATPFRDELRRLFKAWFASGPNLAKLFLTNPEVARAAKTLRAELVPTPGAVAKLHFASEQASDQASHAMNCFLYFLVNPFSYRLAGPCKCCDNFFLKKQQRREVYCSRRCASKHTSSIANRERRKKEFDKNLEEVRKYIAEWRKSKRRMDWKEYVCQQTRISKHWLTKRIREGRLSEPV